MEQKYPLRDEYCYGAGVLNSIRGLLYYQDGRVYEKDLHLAVVVDDSVTIRRHLDGG